MERHLEYYNKKVKCYKKLSENLSFLEPFLYLKEREYYNLVDQSVEYVELNKIYNYVFEYVVHLLDKLEIDTVEGIFAYTCFLLDLGYLSYDRNLPFSNVRIESSEMPILPALVFNHHGRCRHNASFFSDILNHKGFRSYILIGVKVELEDMLNKKAINYEKANHAVTVAEDIKYSYILDSSTREVYGDITGSETYSNRLTKFSLCKDRTVPYGDKLYFDFKPLKPVRNAKESIEDVLKYIKIIASAEKEFDDLHEKIKPALHDAEKVYQRIIKS